MARKAKNDAQLVFSLPTLHSGRSRVFQLRRGVMAWFMAQSPMGLATDVVCRRQGQRLDVAGFWSRAVRDRETHQMLLQPCRSVGVICLDTREAFWKACTTQPELLRRLQSLHLRMHAREKMIQRREPELRRRDQLFEEYAVWDYSQTADEEYRKMADDAASLEVLLHKGTRLERILRSGMVNELYVAVPSNVIDTEDVPGDCGLLWLDRALNVMVRREPVAASCALASQLHFVQMVAEAAMGAQLSLAGIRRGRDGALSFVVPSRQRHKGESPRL